MQDGTNVVCSEVFSMVKLQVTADSKGASDKRKRSVSKEGGFAMGRQGKAGDSREGGKIRKEAKGNSRDLMAELN